VPPARGDYSRISASTSFASSARESCHPR